MQEDFREEQFWNRQKLCKRFRKMKYGKTNRIAYFMLFVVLMGVIQYGRTKYPEWREAHSGIPDVVSSISMNNEHHLKVVANSGRIDNKEEFARQVIHMCQNNSFHSVRFSTDINGYPTGLDITVYLNRREMEKGEPVCKIEFSTDDFTGEYDIKNDAEKFHLYLDGKEIEFY